MVILVVVGVLGILAVLSVAFVTLARLERRASQQRVQALQATLLARSGLEDVMARLDRGQDASWGAVRYAGEDWDAGGTLNGSEIGAEIFQRGVLNVLDCPLRHALRPSFFAANAAGMPLGVAVDGRSRGYSGRLDAGIVPQRLYAVKVEDESGKLNVNGGFLDGGDRDGDGIPDFRDPEVRTAAPSDTGQGWNGQLTRVLDLLGAQPELGIPNLGTLAMQGRPAGGYASVRALQQALGTARDLTPYLTTSSWIDRKVVHPNAIPGQAGGALSDVKRARRRLALEEGGRPPVNLNAAPRPVLLALVDGLSGISFHAPEVPEAYTLDAAMAAGIVDALLARRAVSPFSTWPEFCAFCDGLVTGGTVHGPAWQAFPAGGGDLARVDLLKAAFDPNTLLAKELPDQILYRWVDKSDLTSWSTEGSLGPTGTFTVGVVARILDASGRLLAEATAGSTLRAFDLLRQTTQRDFLAGRSPDAGPTSVLSLSTDPLVQMTGASASWNLWGAGTGLAALTYPHPMTALPANPSDVDGRIGLATTELPTASSGMCFLHHFDDSWTADLGSPAARLPGPYQAASGPMAYDDRLQADLAQGAWPDPATEPNTLCPDGMHAQDFRSPGFLALGNLPAFQNLGNHAVISFWAKLPVQTGRMAFQCKKYLGGTQALMVGLDAVAGVTMGTSWGMIVENCDAGSDLGFERPAYVTWVTGGARVLQPGLRWELVSAFFDTNETATGQDANVRARGVRGAGTLNLGASYGAPFDTGLTQDLTTPSLPFVLGNMRTSQGFPDYARPANEILDEFVICDFGDGAAAALLRLDLLQAQRFRDGRYYKGDDGSFLSAVLNPDGGARVRLLRAQWTAYRPNESRLESVGDWGPVYYGDPADPPTISPRPLDAALADAHVELDLLDEAGTTVLQPLVQGAPLGLVRPGFRYRARFVNALSDPVNQGVLESPFLDDVTFAFQRQGGPRLLAWGP